MIAILVPVLGRAQQIEPLLANINATTSEPHRVVWLCSPSDDARKVCQQTDATTLVAEWHPGRADYAKKLALGYHATSEPWLFQAATDLVFYAGWDQQALAMARKFGRGVVGTNDMGNPSVKRGKHSTHSLIARDYIETYGGTADGSGVIFSEAYDHQYCDNEFIELARRRRQFIFARNSYVEHRHPHWGKAEDDETYRKAMRQTKADMELWVERHQLLRHMP